MAVRHGGSSWPRMGLVILLVSVIGACSGHRSPHPGPHKLSPSEAAAVRRDTDAAVAVARQWLSAYQQGVNTGDMHAVSDMTAEGSRTLDKVTNYVNGLWAAGSVKAPDLFQNIRVQSASADDPTTSDARVVLKFDTGSEIDYDKAGNVIHSYAPAHGLVYIFRLDRPWPPPSPPRAWWVEEIGGPRPPSASPKPQPTAAGPSAVTNLT